MATPSGSTNGQDGGTLPGAPAQGSSGVVHTTLTKSWVVKMVAFLVVLFLFGCWGAFDGFYLYPKRGEADAAVKLRDYLEAAQRVGQLSQVAVDDPQTVTRDLLSREDELRRQAQGESQQARKAQLEITRLEWLKSLQRIFRLTPERTSRDAEVMKNPVETLTSLRDRFKTEDVPKPLDTYDMHFQFLFMGIGWIGSAWILIVLAKARAQSRKYLWDASTQRLTLASGATMVPADIAEFDKRKWHKYFVTLVTNDQKRHTLDLLRFTPLEAWVLEMERTRFPESAASSASESAEAADRATAPPSGDAALSGMPASDQSRA